MIDFASSNSCNNKLNGRLLSGKQAYAIDSKVDDGSPEAGEYHAEGESISGDCDSSSVCVSGSAYILTETTPGCRFRRVMLK